MPTYTWAEPMIPGTEPSIIRRENDDGSVSFIPSDPANKDYQEFLVYEAAQKEAAEKTPKKRRGGKP